MLRGTLQSVLVWLQRHAMRMEGKLIRVPTHKEDETWVPLDPNDQVFHTQDGDVVPIVLREPSLFGALVRGTEKRLSPLIIINPWTIKCKWMESRTLHSERSSSVTQTITMRTRGQIRIRPFGITSPHGRPPVYWRLSIFFPVIADTMSRTFRQSTIGLF